MRDRTALNINRRKEELGASLVEYGLLLALVAVILIPTLQVLGQKVNGTFDKTNQGFVMQGDICAIGHPNYPDCF